MDNDLLDSICGWQLPDPGYDASLLLERCRRRQARALADLGQRICRDVTACVAALCHENPGLGGIGWRCYEPIYNDGSPAGMRATPTPLDADLSPIRRLDARARVVERFRQAFPPDVLRLAFGVEVQVLIAADGRVTRDLLSRDHSREDL